MPRPLNRKIRSESDMANAVKHHLMCRRKVVAGREVKLGRGRLDVVAYDKIAKIFKIVECKLHSSPKTIGTTFGQAVTYLTSLEGEGRVLEFLNGASERLENRTRFGMRFGRWWEATHKGKEISVVVYVALTDKACNQPEFWPLRKQYPQIGVIRVKPNGYCRDTLKLPDGTKDAKAAEAVTKIFSL